MTHVAPGLLLGGLAVLFSSLGALSGCNSGDDGINISQAGAGGATGGSSGAAGSMGGSGGAAAGGASATGGNGTGGNVTAGNGGSGGMGAACTPVFLDAGVSSDAERDAGADAGDSGPGASNGPVGFAADIYPILQANCGPCHTTDYSGGHNVASSDEAEAYGFAQTLAGRILERVNGGGMPPTCSGVAGDPGCLSVAEVDLIRRWTAQCSPP